MEAPIDFNRSFSREVLHDWWLWQKRAEHVVVPPIWLAQQDCLDLWFHMFSTAEADCPEYLERLVWACVEHRAWSFNDFCTTLLYWDQHRNFLSNQRLMEHLLSIFSQISPDFCRAVAVSGLSKDGATVRRADVVVCALEHWNRVNCVSTDSLIWGASWTFLKTQNNSGATDTLVEYLAQWFHLEDFLWLLLPNELRHMNEKSLNEDVWRIFQTSHGVLPPPDVRASHTLRASSMKALTVLRHWPQKCIHNMDVLALQRVCCYFERDQGNTEDHWFVRDWLTQLRMTNELDHQGASGETQGRRKI